MGARKNLQGAGRPAEPTLQSKMALFKVGWIRATARPTLTACSSSRVTCTRRSSKCSEFEAGVRMATGPCSALETDGREGGLERRGAKSGPTSAAATEHLEELRKSRLDSSTNVEVEPKFELRLLVKREDVAMLILLNR